MPEIKDILEPGTEEHSRVLNLVKRLRQYSEHVATSRHDTWREAEQNYRAFIDLEAHEKARKKKAKESSSYPGAVPIMIPMTFAGVQIQLFFLTSIFGARRPVIEIHGRGPEDIEPATKIETVINYQFEHSINRGPLKWYYWFQDALIYGTGIMYNFWRRIVEPRVLWERPKVLDFQVPFTPPRKVEKPVLVFEGNSFDVIDPYKFYPDPRFPLSEVQRGEFFGFDYISSLHDLYQQPEYFNLEHIGKTMGYSDILPQQISTSTAEPSDRQAIVGVDLPVSLETRVTPGAVRRFELQAKIIPQELGIGETNRPEIWIFTTIVDKGGNPKLVIRAERSDYDFFNISALEYNPSAHQVFNQGFVETFSPLQGYASWLLNSHMENVRRVLNNMLVIDPSRIIVEDLEEGGPGLLLRLRQEYYGTDVRTVVHQIPIVDVTSTHLNDIIFVSQMFKETSGLADALFGAPARGRRSALEMGGVQAAAAGRLKVLAELFSSGGVIPLAKQMVSNTQRFLTEEAFYKIAGREATPEDFVKIAPHEISGEFDFPVTDGTFPLDPYRSAEVWREILMGVAGSEILSSKIDVLKLFEKLARTLGIKNIDDFKMQGRVVPDEEIARATERGTAIPVEGSLGKILAGAPLESSEREARATA